MNPLATGLALEELAGHFYAYLPGKPHPFGNRSLSFPAIAAELGIAQYWPQIGSKRPAIRQLLGTTLEREPLKFQQLVKKVVERGVSYRAGKNIPIERNEIVALNRILLKLELKIPELHDANFLNSLPNTSPEKRQKGDPIVLEGRVLTELNSLFQEISSLPANTRGFAFEKFLSEIFATFKLAPRGSFRNPGEQIDGSFTLKDEPYLLEAKWQDKQIGNSELQAFTGKVRTKASWARGLYVSYSGFTVEGLDAFSRGASTKIVCMDGLDLSQVLSGRLALPEVLERKIRRAAETGRAFVPVRELFTSVI